MAEAIPEPVARVADLMSSYRSAWALCGGWAADAWVGRQTRDHEDVDIAIFDDDQRAIFDHLAGWQLVGHDENVADDTSEPWDGRRLSLPAHIHARHGNKALPSRLEGAAEQGFGLEILLNERSQGEWILSREPRMTIPVARCIKRSPWGLPTLVPELVLFYKATAYFESKGLRPHDEQDFTVVAPHLDEHQRSWLESAVARLYPDHPWLEQLSAASAPP